MQKKILIPLITALIIIFASGFFVYTNTMNDGEVDSEQEIEEQVTEETYEHEITLIEEDYKEYNGRELNTEVTERFENIETFSPPGDDGIYEVMSEVTGPVHHTNELGHEIYFVTYEFDFETEELVLYDEQVISDGDTISFEFEGGRYIFEYRPVDQDEEDNIHVLDVVWE